MAFYYVKSGGTATGDGGRFASAQTGSFAALGASSYYDNVVAAMGATTPPAGGDYILASDAHAHTYSAGNQTLTGGTSGSPVHCISASDTAIDATSSGAAETAAAGSDFVITNTIFTYGFTWTSGDDFISTSSNSHFILNSSTLDFDAANDLINLQNTDAGQMTLIDSIVNCPDTTNFIALSRGGTISMRGGGFTADTSVANLINSSQPISQGFRARFEACDLSAITGYLLAGVGADTGDDAFLVLVDGCQINGSLTGFAEEQFLYPDQEMWVTRCAGTAAPAEYQFFYRNWRGDAESETTIVRSETEAFTEGSTKVSIKITTKSTASRETPFIFEFPARYAELATASTDTLRFYFASTSTLTDGDIWFEVYAPDGTNKHVYNGYTNAVVETGSLTVDPFATGTEHTDDSGSSTWLDGMSDLAGSNEYRADVDTSGDAAADCLPVVKVYVGIASATIYLDTEYDLVA